jgi:MYXO-CTERM domain-containing protein
VWTPLKMCGARRLVIIAGVLIVASLSTRPAQAYVRSLTQPISTQPALPLYWSSSCEALTIYLNGFSAMTADEVAKSIGAAAAAWGPDNVTCPADVGDGGNGHPSFEILLQLSTGGPVPRLVDDSGNAIRDGQNSIVFETANYDGPYGSLAYAQVSREPAGRIVEVDIAINALPSAGFEWVNLDPGASPGGHLTPYDLQTVMTHEFGHLLGLAHTCLSNPYSGGSDDGNDVPAGTKDDKGQTIPSCDDPGVPQYAAVMWAKIEDSSSAKRILSTDDARGVCTIYPPERNAPACTQNLPDDGCGCASAGAPARSLATFVLVAMVLATRRRRASHIS